jgi:hypothetical protein
MKNWKVISILVSDFMTMFAILIGRIEIAFGIALVSIALAALITIFDKEFTAKNQDFKSFLLAMGGVFGSGRAPHNLLRSLCCLFSYPDFASRLTHPTRVRALSLVREKVWSILESRSFSWRIWIL